ncbi:MAG: GHKL domain-containing protein [Blautia obeum]
MQRVCCSAVKGQGPVHKHQRDADSHGIGLHTVGKLVKKYAGIMRVEVGEQEFSVKLIFTIK